MLQLGALACSLLCIRVVTSNIGTYEVTRRDFPFVDPSRCRQPDFCGIASEWDLKFGRPIPAVVYSPGNATHFFNVSSMDVMIFGLLQTNDEFHELLTGISSAGVVVICVHLQNEQVHLDYLKDLLKVAFDMYYENESPYSPFHQLLSGFTTIVGYGEMANKILWICDKENFIHSSVKGIVSLSPSLWAEPTADSAATDICLPTLIIAGTADAWRPVAHARPIYNQIPRGKARHNGVCKTYIEIQGGNHCFFLDYQEGIVSECYQKEMEYPTFKHPSMSHQHQLANFSAQLLMQYVKFSTHLSNQSATEFQQYLIDSREVNQEIQYLQSCYVNETLFAHDKYFPRDTEQKVYRSFV